MGMIRLSMKDMDLDLILQLSIPISLWSSFPRENRSRLITRFWSLQGFASRARACIRVTSAGVRWWYLSHTRFDSLVALSQWWSGFLIFWQRRT